MNSTIENTRIAEKIAEADTRLEKLDREITEIGMPAGQDLRRRLEALKIEEKALRRNFEESIGNSDTHSLRMEKIEALLRHIEQEESSVEHAVAFLHQAAPSSMTLAVETGARMVDLARKGMKAVIGDHHPLGESVFVNQTHETLTHRYGLHTEGDDVPPSPPAKP